MKQRKELIEVNDSLISGKGIFAKRPISKGIYLLKYTGEFISKEKSAKELENGNEYVFTLNDKHDIDGSVDWNITRFVNHSCSPNCEAINVDDEIWIASIKEINEGEELTFNYGYPLEEYKNNPCNCGSENCLGYIVANEDLEKLKQILESEQESLLLEAPSPSQ